MKYTIILDVDGVLTDGTKYYNLEGDVVMKQFKDQDFTAIKRFQEEGHMACWASADLKCNKAIAENRGIPFFYTRRDDGVIDKVPVIEKIVGNGDYTNVVFVGDDYYDIEAAKFILENGGIVGCPCNANSELYDLVMNHDRGRVLVGNDDAVVADLYRVLNSEN